MKIAYVYDAVYPYVRGGVEKRLWELSHRLNVRGHEVHLFGMQWWDGPSVIEDDGVIIHGVCPASPLYADGRRRVTQAVQFAGHLLAPLSRAGADLIDCQNFPYFPCFSAYAASKRHTIPLAITWHEVWGEDYWYEYLGRRGVLGAAVERRVAALPHHPIAVSFRTGRNLERMRSSDSVGIIPNGIDIMQIDACTIAAEESDILFVGRLIPEKHVDLLLRAVQLLQTEIPDLRCRIIGDGPMRPALEQLALDLGLFESVTFTGFLPDYDAVISAMKASKVFVLPSTREGFGIVVLEAMACGLPVVTIDHPMNAAADLVRPEVNGYCSGLSVEGLAEGILLSLDIAVRSRNRIKDSVLEYDWDSIVRKTEDLYTRLCDG